jgi:branched-chain amino acid transport system substrate-binding protein
MMLSGPGSTALTGKQCSPNHVHFRRTPMCSPIPPGPRWSRREERAVTSLRPATPGQQLAKDGAAAVNKGGGTVLGSALYPFPGTSDFSALLLQAQASGAKVLALCNGGADTVGRVKKAREFGLQATATPVQRRAFSLLGVDLAAA